MASKRKFDIFEAGYSRHADSEYNDIDGQESINSGPVEVDEDIYVSSDEDEAEDEVDNFKASAPIPTEFHESFGIVHLNDYTERIDRYNDRVSTLVNLLFEEHERVRVSNNGQNVYIDLETSIFKRRFFYDFGKISQQNLVQLELTATPLPVRYALGSEVINMNELRIYAPRVEKSLHLGVRGENANLAHHPDGLEASYGGSTKNLWDRTQCHLRCSKPGQKANSAQYRLLQSDTKWISDFRVLQTFPAQTNRIYSYLGETIHMVITPQFDVEAVNQYNLQMVCDWVKMARLKLAVRYAQVSIPLNRALPTNLHMGRDDRPQLSPIQQVALAALTVLEAIEMAATKKARHALKAQAAGTLLTERLEPLRSVVIAMYADDMTGDEIFAKLSETHDLGGVTKRMFGQKAREAWGLHFGRGGRRYSGKIVGLVSPLGPLPKI